MEDFPPSPSSPFTWTNWDKPSSWSYSYSYAASSSAASTEPSPRWTGSSSSGGSSSASSAASMGFPAPLALPKATLDEGEGDHPSAASIMHDGEMSDGHTTTSSYSSCDGYGSSTPPGVQCALAPKDLALGVDGHPLVVPDNFAQVAEGVYRSSFPAQKHLSFLKTLGLKTILTLVSEEYPVANAEFVTKEGIKFFQIGFPDNKKPITQIPEEKVVQALSIVLDKRNHPMLIHCNKGKHRTGCLVGCLRRAQKWEADDIRNEYLRYSFPKSRGSDQLYIQNFSLLDRALDGCEAEHLPHWLTPELSNGDLSEEPEEMSSAEVVEEACEIAALEQSQGGDEEGERERQREGEGERSQSTPTISYSSLASPAAPMEEAT